MGIVTRYLNQENLLRVIELLHGVVTQEIDDTTLVEMTTDENEVERREKHACWALKADAMDFIYKVVLRLHDPDQGMEELIEICRFCVSNIIPKMTEMSIGILKSSTERYFDS